jgi:acetyl-CoA acyltransferase 2
MTILKGVFVVAAKRTAFGKFGGKLKDMSATDLQVIANKAAIEQSKLSADKIDSVVVGNILHVKYIYIYKFIFVNIFKRN